MFPDVTVEAMKHYRVFQNIYIKNDFEFMLFVFSAVFRYMQLGVFLICVVAGFVQAPTQGL